LPVLYRDSGGVPELVGACGVATTCDTFSGGLATVLDRLDDLRRAARDRAVTMFAAERILPEYLAAIDGASRRPPLRRRAVLQLTAEGYPAWPLADPVRPFVARALGAGLTLLASRRRSRMRVGWITYDSYPDRKRRFAELEASTRMRAGSIGRWINEHSDAFHTEVYRPGEPYDIVIFQKVMDARAQADAAAIRARGGSVVFDANVNYYDIWGDYFVDGTRPTGQQQRDALAMTTLADWVVADSSYLAGIIRPLNPRVTHVSDNVNTDIYRGERAHRPHAPVTLIWSGMVRKAAHLELLVDVLPAVPNVALVLVSDRPPEIMRLLGSRIPVHFVPFSDRRYARALLDADVIISPKRLCNGYEMGHTEYKITLGMAVGLPAVASRQQSYVEAIGAHGGGLLADTPEEWERALRTLADDATIRGDRGARARRTVLERYSTPVVARQYLDVLERLTDIPSPPAANVKLAVHAS